MKVAIMSDVFSMKKMTVSQMESEALQQLVPILRKKLQNVRKCIQFGGRRPVSRPPYF